MDKNVFNQPYSTSRIKSPCSPNCSLRSAYCKRTCPEWAAYEKAKEQEAKEKDEKLKGVVISRNMERILRNRLLRYKYSHL